jgi:hypothetical protein
MSKVSLIAFQAVDIRGFSYTLCDSDHKGNDGVLKDKVPGLLDEEMLALLLEVKQKCLNDQPGAMSTRQLSWFCPSYRESSKTKRR